MKINFRKIELERGEEAYDVLIIGGGPAGLAAAMYSARFGLRAAVLTEKVGGQLLNAGPVEDYLGVISAEGPELASLFEKHVAKYGVPIILGRAEAVERTGNGFKVFTEGGDSYWAKAVVVAVGERRRKLGVRGEEEFAGRGVSYCAPCDAPLFKGKVVAVVGGGDAAAQAALMLTNYAERVYLIHRRDKLRAQEYYQGLILKNPKIEVLWNTVVEELRGDKALREAVLRRLSDGGRAALPIDGIFIEIGAEPPVEFFKRIGVKLTPDGYIEVGPDMSTSIPGVFAAGDCTSATPRGFKQVQLAAAQGALAAYSAYNHLIRTGGITE
ncbi:MAG: NAD(P)/FAD-dependent oxidoreductase [Thermoproteus sp. AZ2]|jgi:thioredoxin reductase (NADPH)|uniref:NAD(P)/FAD-dependent oxidoreductase n=1 Tax=Thermoproteus sp. AZ2 TaxID=1609232 RepID=A0ACC6V2A7_9CREN|nr:MAG: thioredoxin reductase [Thermoproteus sp. AZ2]